MKAAEAFNLCEAAVRKFDADRYFATLFAPAGKRRLLYALYAFNHELAWAGETTREPVAAAIRLRWWRDVLLCAADGNPPAHPVAVALAEVFQAGFGGSADLERLVDAREAELLSEPFGSIAAMESHAKATSASLMRMAVRLLVGRDDAAPGPTNDAGIAYGLTGMLRNLPLQAARSKLFPPGDSLAGRSLFTGTGAEVKRAVDQIAFTALGYLDRARGVPISPTVFPGLLPASLVGAYTSRLKRTVDPLRSISNISQLRRQLILLRAALRGHL